MPILAAEPSVFPEDLFQKPRAADKDRWLVIHTRPRSEKALTRRLLKGQVSFFLPQYRREWRHRGRRLSSYLPLFPGYVFLLGDNDARLQALETNLVANILNVSDQEQLFQDLFQVHLLMTSGASLTPEERLQPGAKVEIVDGPFAGMEGKIITRNNLRLVVEVRFIHQGVSVDIESWMIRPASTGRIG
jgi:transcriptional antiterminator NusG